EAVRVGDAQRAADRAVLVGGLGQGGKVLAGDDAVLLVGQREGEVRPHALVDRGELREVEDARGDERLAALAEDEEDAAAAFLGDQAALDELVLGADDVVDGALALLDLAEGLL